MLTAATVIPYHQMMTSIPMIAWMTTVHSSTNLLTRTTTDPMLKRKRNTTRKDLLNPTIMTF